MVDVSLLRCDRCSSALSLESDCAVCRSCDRKVPVKAGAYVFNEPPGDAPQSTQTTDPRTWSNWRKANFAFFKKALPEDASLKVLDIGAGPSQFWDLFKRYKTYTGLDFYPYEKVDIVADFTKPLPVADGAFDLVILSNVLEHVPDPEALLQEAHRVLRQKGMILAATPFLVRVHQAPYDFARYTSFGHEALFAKARFSNISVEPLGSLVDVYRTITRHFFVELKQKMPHSFIADVLHLKSKVMGRVLAFLFKGVPASVTYSEGFGVIAKK